MQKKFKGLTNNAVAWLLVILVLAGAGAFAGTKIYQNRSAALQAEKQEKDIYLAFSDEVYDTIVQNYWDKIPDDKLTELYHLAAAKINSTTPATLASKDKTGLNKLISSEIKNLAADKKKEFVTALANLVLQNLPPLGRSQLYTQQLVQALSNEINNVDTSANLYSELGVDKNASEKQIEQTHQEQVQKLEKEKTPEAAQKLAIVNRAYEALKTPERRQQYDQTGVEPAVTYRPIGANTYYVKISRFSPTLLEELQTAATSTPTSASALILDLRGNIGGAIDQLPAVISDFLGPSQATFNFYHQGSYIPFPSANPALRQFSNFKQVIILTDSQTQSSTEVLVGALKKSRFGIVVGAATRGWGSVERVFALQNQIDDKQQYSVFLVHTLTLADDNQPIEGRGVQPNVNVAEKDWAKKLTDYYHSPALTAAVQNLLGQ